MFYHVQCILLTMLLCRWTIKTSRQFIQKAVQEEKPQSVEVCQWAWQNYPVYYNFILSTACWLMFLNMILSGRDLGCVSGQYWPGISERQERSECRTKRNMDSEVPEEGDGLTNVWHPKHRYKTLFEAHFKALWLMENDRLKSIIWFCMMKWCFQPNACYRTTASSLIWIWVLWRSARSHVTLSERAKFTSHRLWGSWRNYTPLNLFLKSNWILQRRSLLQ